MSLNAFTKARFLLCEGDDDKGFFEALIAARSLPDFQVCHTGECCGTGGITGFAPSLKGMVALSGWRNVRGLLLVSDNDTAASFGVVQQALTSNGFSPPPDPTGVGEMGGKPVAVLMIPHSSAVGDIETLSLPCIYAKWPKARICVPLFLRCTGALTLTGGPKWPRRASISKARARATTVGFNADDPYKGIGHLFRNGTLSVKHPCFDAVASFLRGFDAMCGI